MQSGSGIRVSGFRVSGIRGSGIRGSGIRASGIRASGVRVSRMLQVAVRASGLYHGCAQSGISRSCP